MVERRRRNETRYRGFSPDGVNPDRVKIETADSKAWDELRKSTKHVLVEKAPSWSLVGAGKNRVRLFARAALASLALLTFAGNAGVERRTPVRAGHEVAETLSARDFLVRVNDEINRIVSVDFIDRFSTIDAEGNRIFNPGALVFPVSVGVTSAQNFQVAIELNIPYDWARTFREVQQTDPARAEELKTQLVEQLREQVRNQVIIHGIPGLTNSTAVWNAHGAQLAVAENGTIVPPGTSRLAVDEAVITGYASDEATEASSLGSGDAQNETLAASRGEDLKPLILEALRSAGFDVENVDSVSLQETENYLTPAEIDDLADIAYRQSRWEREGGMPEEWAMRTIFAYNHGEGLDLTPADTALLERVLNQQRRVDAVVTATGTEHTFRTWNVGLFLPLALMLVGLQRNPGGKSIKLAPFRERVSVIEITRAAVARRIFSESTPRTLNTERDFNAVYDSVSLTGERRDRDEDLQRMRQHMLVEEVLPSLNPRTKEPFIDYLQIANEALRYMYSDSRKDGIKKGRYPTSGEAQRFIAEKLVEMWEHHDQATYPMSESPLGPIDIKKVLNYRHSEHVVTWAKLLAEQLVSVSQQLYAAKNEALKGASGREVLPIVTRDEFEASLRRRIAANAQATGGYSDRNVFVVSNQPDEGEYGEYKARVNTY